MSIIEGVEKIERDLWDGLRLKVLGAASVLVCPDSAPSEFENFLVALTDAFDEPEPGSYVYQRLSRFYAGQWPLLCRVIEQQEHISATAELTAVLRASTDLLRHAAGQRDAARAESLDVDLAVLQQLLTP